MGLLVAVYHDSKNDKWMTSQVSNVKKGAGIKFGKNACIHYLDGNVVTLTPARRKAVRAEHLRLCAHGVNRCKKHCVAWKAK